MIVPAIFSTRSNSVLPKNICRPLQWIIHFQCVKYWRGLKFFCTFLYLILFQFYVPSFLQAIPCTLISGVSGSINDALSFTWGISDRISKVTAWFSCISSKGGGSQCGISCLHCSVKLCFSKPCSSESSDSNNQICRFPSFLLFYLAILQTYFPFFLPRTIL